MSEHLLLDTCAAIWISDGAKIAPAAMAALEATQEGAGSVSVSPITAWEIGMLAARGRISLSVSPKTWYRALVGLPGVRERVLDGDTLIDASFLPGKVHGDPADRMIITTARTHGLTVVTRDRKILDYATQGHVRAIAC